MRRLSLVRGREARIVAGRTAHAVSGRTLYAASDASFIGADRMWWRWLGLDDAEAVSESGVTAAYDAATGVWSWSVSSVPATARYEFATGRLHNKTHCTRLAVAMRGVYCYPTSSVLLVAGFSQAGADPEDGVGVSFTAGATGATPRARIAGANYSGSTAGNPFYGYGLVERASGSVASRLRSAQMFPPHVVKPASYPAFAYVASSSPVYYDRISVMLSVSDVVPAELTAQIGVHLIEPAEYLSALGALQWTTE